MNKKILLLFLAMTVAGALLYGANSAKAFGFRDSKSSPLVEKMVEKFGLNQDEVVAAFEEVRTERYRKKQEFMESRLNQAVADGVITQKQKQALLDKQAEMQQKHQQEREEMRSWLEASGIDFEKLAPYAGFGHHGFGRWHMGY